MLGGAASERLLQLERDAVEAVEALRWGPLDSLFVAVSSGWRFPMFLGLAVAADVIARRRWPVCAPLAVLTVLAASLLAGLFKDEFERSRPRYTDFDIEPLVDTPGSPSFPSAHALTAFAAATIISAYEPRLKWPAFGLAAAVGFSRVYLGVHFWLDVLVGAALGVALGYGAARLAKDAGRRLRARSAPSA